MKPLPFRSRKDVEWLGARYELPAMVRDEGETVRPSVDLWLELPSGKIVGMTMVDPRAPASFVDGLKDVIAKPAEGAPRKPACIRVPDAALADDLRASIGDEIEIQVSLVPELDQVVAELSSTLQSVAGEHSYLGGGKVRPEVVGESFAAAERLFRAAPWKAVLEDQLVRADCPALGLEGAAICIIGAAAHDFGLLLFRSLQDYEKFTTRVIDSMEDAPSLQTGDGPWSLLSLSYTRKRDLSSSMQREIEGHRWPVAGSKAHPLFMALGPEGAPQPFTERDYQIVTACTLAFLDFLESHRDLFDEEQPKTIREVFTKGGLTVTVTAPYGSLGSSAVKELLTGQPSSVILTPQEPLRSVGRNDFCPCGSGKKYKRCHLDANRSPLAGAPSAGESVHEMDQRLVHGIGRFAIRRYGDCWLEALERGLEDEAKPLFIPWAAWTVDVNRRRIAESFLDEHRADLSPDEQAWSDAQLSAWLSLWEVMHVQPGRIEMRDLLTGAVRAVRENQGSRSVVVRDAMLARVIDFRGTSYIGGLYARALPPAEADRAVASVRRVLRLRKGDVPAERLRDTIAGRTMMTIWSEAVRDLDERRSRPPVLTNTDGETMVFVTDSLPFDAKRRSEIEERVRAMDGVDDVSQDDGATVITFVRRGNRMHKSWENTVVGRVSVRGGVLEIETNSEPRADALRLRIRDACAGLLQEGRRRKRSPAQLMKQREKRPHETRREKPRTELEIEAIRQVKEAHYRDWLDEPIPGLGGKTPRAASRTKKWREQLDLILREMENHEARLPEAERFDVGRIRTELGMAESRRSS